MEEIKFTFDPSFQREILRFALTDIKYGFKAVVLFESHYFTLTEDAIIAEVIKRYYNKRYSVPSYPIFLEEFKNLMRLKQYKNLVTEDDKKKIRSIVRRLYKKPAKDPETIYEACQRFAQFSALKSVLEEIDIFNYNSYPEISPKIQKAISLGNSLKEDKGMFVLSDVKSRIIRRKDRPPGHPTPWWQLNATMNAGGTMEGTIIVLLAPAKRFKTGFLVNTAIGNLKQGRVTLHWDMENGEDAISTRADQSLINVDRKTLLSEDREIENKLFKKIRQYKRFGGEYIIRRAPAGSTAGDISNYITWVWENYNIKVTDLICDYPDIMKPLSGDRKSDTDNISQVYIDLKNIANEHGLINVWCPSHVNREGDKIQNKKFKATDTAKSMDKIRHADIILGIQQDDAEKEAGIIRLEIIEQRDGKPDGSIYLWAHLDTQRVKEFTRQEVKEIEELKADADDDEDVANTFKNRGKVTSDV